MRLACIDVGSNTTRLLVADCAGGRLDPVHEERVFTLAGSGSDRSGAIAENKLALIASVVAAQAGSAAEQGAREVRAVATGVVRRAPNVAALLAAVRAGCGLELRVLSEREEAALAFLGAASALGEAAGTRVAVIDVGGGSSEVAVGAGSGKVSWWRSLPLGSGSLTSALELEDPPSAAQRRRLSACVAAALMGLEIPPASVGLAVGGSATSLARLAGERLEPAELEQVLTRICSAPASALAAELGLELQRVRLLPAGLAILIALCARLPAPVRIGHGGLREGVLLHAAAGG
jgi:exopolyphosphatase/guanosine-5'-triphosphate,3'-diphosphate pyrophosphatase